MLTTYEFDELPFCVVDGVTVATVSGSATISVDPDGEWQVIGLSVTGVRPGGLVLETVTPTRHQNREAWHFLVQVLEDHRRDAIDEAVALAMVDEGMPLPGSRAEHRIGAFEAGVGRAA